MLTENFRMHLRATSCGAGNVANGMKTIDGTIVTSSTGFLLNSTRDIIIGLGNTAPTKDDYCLENPITLEDEGIVKNPTSSSDVGTYVNHNEYGFLTSKTFTNNTNEAVTIQEVGLLGYTGANTPKALICREVISPITIQPNETFTVTIKVG